MNVWDALVRIANGESALRYERTKRVRIGREALAYHGRKGHPPPQVPIAARTCSLLQEPEAPAAYQEAE
jgi:hypothetical protein